MITIHGASALARLRLGLDWTERRSELPAAGRGRGRGCGTGAAAQPARRRGRVSRSSAL